MGLSFEGAWESYKTHVLPDREAWYTWTPHVNFIGSLARKINFLC